MGLDGYRSKVDDSSPANKLTKEDVEKQLIEFAKNEDVKLTYDNFNANKDYASSRTVENKFGTWNEALDEVGVDKNRDLSPMEVTDDMYEPSAEKAYIVGVLMGDGHYRNDTTMVLNVADKDFAVEFGKAIAEWAGLQWDGFESDDTEIGCSVIDRSKYDEQDQYQVQKGMNDISTHMKQYRYPNSHEAIIEEFEDYLPELVRGLWDSEGWVRKDGRIGFTNQHMETLLTYLKALISVLDIPDDEVYVEERSDDYLVYVPYYHAPKFFKLIDPTIQRKKDKIDNIAENKAPDRAMVREKSNTASEFLNFKE